MDAVIDRLFEEAMSRVRSKGLLDAGS
jgi:hypothetical protein